ncbi:uncharacterized protein BKA55DRAFT_563207 [Fusarium redolens]|jgi:hypothetical protein|uniref:Uncharacterized protein n=1 Tax=Fusarium redolens TaxID=48865 RepID=A0A9P9KFN7_FUSRE|nr:uncharacterized protein BKA55DRAFT_563207 [Fusarium redolens]KAH7259753.1 hypothetical protein BKA55DRAFT_563207 [Fusarium redolens]
MRLLVLACHIRMCPDSVAGNYIYDLKLPLSLPIPSIDLANYTLGSSDQQSTQEQPFLGTGCIPLVFILEPSSDANSATLVRV